MGNTQTYAMVSAYQKYNIQKYISCKQMKSMYVLHIPHSKQSTISSVIIGTGHLSLPFIQKLLKLKGIFPLTRMIFE